MTGRTFAPAAAAASVVIALASAGCGVSFYEIPIETPILAKIDTTDFQRVLVAGFVSGGSDDVDPNTETARLLRSQLRTRSDLRVVDTEPLALVDEVDRRRGTPPRPVNPDEPAEPAIQTEADLEAYDEIFEDAEFWKDLGDRFQGPLIVTGSILFRPVAQSGIRSVPTTTISQSGLPVAREDRRFVDMRGYALTPTFVFIDGRTGEVLYSESFHEEVLYSSSQNTPALSSYFELMDKLLPGFLNTMNTQRIRGTRALLK